MSPLGQIILTNSSGGKDEYKLTIYSDRVSMQA